MPLARALILSAQRLTGSAEAFSGGRTGGTVITRTASGEARWWTWAGFKANSSLTATLSEPTDPKQTFDDRYIRLRENITYDEWQRLAVTTLAARLAGTDPRQICAAGASQVNNRIAIA